MLEAPHEPREMPGLWLGRWIVVLALALGSLPAVPALAKPKANEQQAQTLNEQARQAFKDGHFDEAADLFLQVYDLVRTPTAVFNAARAREASGKLPEAKALFELYLRIEKSAEGQDDARKRIAEIDATLRQQADTKARQEAEARSQADAEATRARLAAEAAARKAEQERLELEQLKAQERARAEAAAKAAAELAGVTFLPPTGASTEDSVRAIQAVLQASMAEAQAAMVAPVHPVADYIQAEMARNLPAACDFHCQLGLARSLGSAYAVTTALRYENGQVRMRQVLWRTRDATDAAQVEIAAWTLPGLQRANVTLGELWNPLRRFVIQPGTGQPGPGMRPQLEVVSEPPGALLTFDDVDVGLTPMVVTCEPGTHRVRLVLAGRSVRAGSLVTTQGSQRLAVKLAEPPPPEAPPAHVKSESREQTPPRTDTPPRNTQPALIDRQPRTQPPVVQPQPAVVPPASRAPAVAEEKSSIRWGIAGSVEGGVALIEDTNKSIQPDVSGGLGGFGHVGYSGSEGPAWVSVAIGLRYLEYQGLSAATGHKAASPHGFSGWLGVLIPPIDLLASVHRTWVSVDNGLSDFSYDTAQVRVFQGKGLFFIAFGVEALLANSRPATDLDEFGKGPNLRLTLELGINGGSSLFK